MLGRVTVTVHSLRFTLIEKKDTRSIKKLLLHEINKKSVSETQTLVLFFHHHHQNLKTTGCRVDIPFQDGVETAGTLNIEMPCSTSVGLPANHFVFPVNVHLSTASGQPSNPWKRLGKPAPLTLQVDYVKGTVMSDIHDLCEGEPGADWSGLFFQRVLKTTTKRTTFAISRKFNLEMEYSCCFHPKGVTIRTYFSHLFTPFVGCALMRYFDTLPERRAKNPELIDQIDELMCFLDVHNKLTSFCKEVCYRELKTCTDFSSALRGNNTSCYIVSRFLQVVGSQFVKRIFKSVMSSVPAFMASAPDLMHDKDRQLDVSLFATTTFDLVTSPETIELIPPGIIDLLRYCHGVTKHLGIGPPDNTLHTLYFLRFLNPGLLSLSSATQNEKTRSIILWVTKLWQRIANGTKFDEGSSQMFLNPFVQRSHKELSLFYQRLVAPAARSRDLSASISSDIPPGKGAAKRGGPPQFCSRLPRKKLYQTQKSRSMTPRSPSVGGRAHSVLANGAHPDAVDQNGRLKMVSSDADLGVQCCSSPPPLNLPRLHSFSDLPQPPGHGMQDSALMLSLPVSATDDSDEEDVLVQSTAGGSPVRFSMSEIRAGELRRHLNDGGGDSGGMSPRQSPVSPFAVDSTHFLHLTDSEVFLPGMSPLRFSSHTPRADSFDDAAGHTHPAQLSALEFLQDTACDAEAQEGGGSSLPNSVCTDGGFGTGSPKDESGVQKAEACCSGFDPVDAVLRQGFSLDNFHYLEDILVKSWDQLVSIAQETPLWHYSTPCSRDDLRLLGVERSNVS